MAGYDGIGCEKCGGCFCRCQPEMKPTATSQLRRWCKVGEQHQDAEERECNGCQPVHYLRLRRMLVCSACEMGFFKREGFELHECYSDY